MPSIQCKYSEKETGQLLKLANFRLPNHFKKWGIGASLLIFGFLVVYKFWGANDLMVKDLCRNMMLFCLLLATMSRDLVEDEYNRHLRGQSYLLAFVFAAAYCICMPLIALGFDLFISKFLGTAGVNFHDPSSFEVLFMLVCFQLLIFETLKRAARAE